MRITSLNLRGFFDWGARLPQIVAYLREIDPDMVLLQEVVFLPDVDARTNAEALNDVLGLAHRHESVTRLQRGRQRSVYREGLAVLSKVPVAASQTLVLKHETGDPHHRIVQFVDVVEPDGLWPVANVHLSVRDDYALHHLGEVLGIISEKGERRILGGDFNVDHLEQHAGLWTDAVLSSSVADYQSHPSTNETDDYFLVPTIWSIDRVRVSGDDLSDHEAITVDLTRR